HSTLYSRRPRSNCCTLVAPLGGERRLLACGRPQLADDILFRGSARLSRAGFGVAPKQSFREVGDDGTSSPKRETHALPGGTKTGLRSPTRLRKKSLRRQQRLRFT